MPGILPAGVLLTGFVLKSAFKIKAHGYPHDPRTICIVEQDGMKPEKRFGLDEVERQQKHLEDAQKPAPRSEDGMSRLGQALVNLPWVVLAVAFAIWWLKQ